MAENNTAWRVSNFCKVKRKKREASDSFAPYKTYKGAKYGIPDLSCCYRDDGALRVNHSRLSEAPGVVIGISNEQRHQRVSEDGPHRTYRRRIVAVVRCGK